MIRPLLDMETFEMKSDRLRKKSPYGHLPDWRLSGLIAKSNDDVRQEVFVMQLIMYYQMAFKTENLPIRKFSKKNS
jgi:phosphatidylinositol 4-kinase